MEAAGIGQVDVGAGTGQDCTWKQMRLVKHVSDAGGISQEHMQKLVGLVKSL